MSAILIGVVIFAFVVGILFFAFQYEKKLGLK
ncbi:MAG: hypothetical protein ACI9O4_000912 [Chitinophagales bacterium]|jgi:hypothetical protein